MTEDKRYIVSDSVGVDKTEYTFRKRLSKIKVEEPP